MRIFLSLIVLVMLLWSCSEGPNCNLSDEQLVGILLDQTLAQANLKDLPVDLLDSLSSDYSHQIWRYHGTDSLQWDICEDYLLQNLERYQDIQKLVADSIQLLYERYQ